MRANRLFILLSLVLAVGSNAFGQGGWKQLKTDAAGDLVAVYFTSADRGWIAGDNGFLAATIDGGRTWTKYPLGTTEDINEIYFRNNDTGYLVAGRKMFMTTDGGTSWKETVIYKPGDFRGMTPEFLSIRFATKNRGLAVGSVLNRRGDVVDSLVMRTEDGGATWKRLFVPTKTELFHLDYNGSSHGWIVGDNGVILATTNAGVEWKLQSSGTKVALFNVDFRDDDEGYAVGEDGLILRTENGGRNWTRVLTDTKANLMRVDFADDKNGWIVGHGGMILRSFDKGRSWVRQESNVTGHLYGLFMTKRYGLAVGAKGTAIEFRR